MTKTAVLITGSAARIGASIARKLALEGKKIIIHVNSSVDTAINLIKDIMKTGGEAELLIGDLNDDNFLNSMLAQASKIAGCDISIIINNASVFENDNAEDLDYENWQKHFHINSYVPCKLSADLFNSKITNGAVINIIDQRVFKQNPYFFTYNLSKMTLLAATKTMAQRFAPKLRVNAVAPGPSLKNIRQSDEDFQKQLDATPLKNGSPPEAIAEAVAFLIKAEHITGQTIAVDGGQSLIWQTPDVEGINE